MTSTVFSAGTVVASSWLNDVNAHVYNTDYSQYYHIAGLTLGAGISGALRTANGVAINAALVAAKAANQTVQLPAGRIEYTGTITAQNGVNVIGQGNMGEDTGAIYHGTTLAYYGTGLAVSMVGTGTSVATRIQCNWSNLVLTDGGSSAATRGIDIGWTQRSVELLTNVTLLNFGDNGIKFTSPEWNLSFRNVRLDTCGVRTAGSAGIGKDTTVDSGNWNAITFYNLQVEGCGTATSVGGAINFPCATTGNRSIHFYSPIIEGNQGIAELYISNITDLQFFGYYAERLGYISQPNAVELLSCTGAFRGGYIAGESKTHDMSGASGQKILTFAGVATIVDGVVGQFVIGTGIAPGSKIASVQAGVGFTLDTNTTGVLSSTSVRYGFPQYGIKATSCELELDGLTCTGFLGGVAQNLGSIIQTRRIKFGTPNAVGYADDATAQWFGDHAPSFSVHRNSVNQTAIATGVFTKVQFTTKVWDETSDFDNVTNYRWTPGSIGKGHIDTSVTFTAAVDQTRIIIALYKNGGVYKAANFQTSGTGSQTAQLSVDIETSATTDYFELFVRQDSGSNKDISGTSDETYFTGSIRG